MKDVQLQQKSNNCPSFWNNQELQEKRSDADLIAEGLQEGCLDLTIAAIANTRGVAIEVPKIMSKGGVVFVSHLKAMLQECQPLVVQRYAASALGLKDIIY